MNNIKNEKAIQIPFVVQLDEMDAESFISYYHHNKDDIENRLITEGAIKLQGVLIDSLATFQQIVNAVSDRFLNYIDGNSPRTKLSDNVYTSTEYDQTQTITMHNELSYSAKWPNKIFFSCLQPAASGGETLIADSREILSIMNKDIVSEIDEKGIMYIRNLHGGRGIGPSWQDTFETQDKDQLEAYCKSLAIDFEWKKDGTLKLMQFSKGIINHRITHERVWFNQVDQFHPSHLDEEIFETIRLMYGSSEDFPMYVTFGDGTTIPDSMIAEILRTIERVTIAPAWQKNELLILDNELVSHGRNSFTGNRKVLVAMSE